ncbi:MULTISPECIES: DinB family protein [Paenibacillus]|uniref:DinB family protein n=1 Tax=Paenibacillus TaxID=44249 RepID=UPI0022B89DD6|nr:DinB family protein [Paenibacillus caseinilyticus]MCZ8518071.1 DinB family protein [Paenibacillus caseinilyticus]
MYPTIQSFIAEYENESTATQKLLDALTDASLAQEIAPGYRNLGHLAWHLVHTQQGLLTGAGLAFEAPAADSPVPASAASIAGTYRQVTHAILEAVQKQWSNESLAETVNLFGQSWTKGETLYIFLKHEIHHRGQLTILMRQAGLPVTGMYGPSKEEWSAMGMEAPV